MIYQSKQERQQSLTAAEVREQLLTDIDASRQPLEDLSDEELESISGGAAAYLPKAAEYVIKGVEKIVYYGSKVITVFRR